MTLNLFPVRVAIGQMTDENGRSHDVMMSREFSRALSDLLVRVGGPIGLGSDDLAALVILEAERGGQITAVLRQLEQLRSAIDQITPFVGVLAEVDRLRKEMALTQDPSAVLRYILTRYAPLESPTFTGIPKAPTAAQDTSTKQLATTEFVLKQAGDALPKSPGTADPGTGVRYARVDHVHPVDTSRQAAITPRSVTGSKTGNTALTLSLLSALAASGLITDNTTP